MKPNTMLTIRFRASLAAAVWAFVLIARLSAQAVPEVKLRFADPAFDPGTRTYTLDIQMTSKAGPEIFFGMNMRFFYDATRLEFRGLDAFAEGHGIAGDLRHAVGTARSGVDLLGLTREAGFVNTAVEARDERYPMTLVPGVWTRLCRVVFTVPAWIQDETFCPSLIWDKQPFAELGGISGSDGVVVTLRAQDRGTRAESIRTVVESAPFNWRYHRTAGLPYGEPTADQCLSLEQPTSVTGPDRTEAEGYVLWQNKPNPFDGETVIEFILPAAQRASFSFYAADGTRLYIVEADYPAGRNTVTLDRGHLRGSTGVIYCQLSAGDIRLVRAMHPVDR